MKKVILFIILMATILSCTKEKTSFDAIALHETFIQPNDEEINFKSILERYKGKTIFIDIWASWCHDCIASLAELKKLQAQEADVVYLMLSLDKTTEKWKNGIKKHQLIGEHYLFKNQWKQSEFCTSINLDWIPRYMIVGKDGSIKMYKAIKITDGKIKKTLNNDK